MILDLNVIPNQKEFKVLGLENQALKLKIKSPPLKGRANQEIEKELKKLFKTKVTIIKGWKSKKKKVLIEKNADELLQQIHSF